MASDDADTYEAGPYLSDHAFLIAAHPRHAIVCDNCGARGPVMPTKPAAVRSWRLGPTHRIRMAPPPEDVKPVKPYDPWDVELDTEAE
jgi:hypothetical protein